MEFKSIVESIRKRLFVFEEEVLIVVGAYVANFLDGPPVWLIVVGPPSSGKTELIELLIKCPRTYPLSGLTPHTFLSAHEAAGGGLLFKLENPSVLLIKELGTLRSLPSYNRIQIFSQFREIYDGRYGKDWGVGKSMVWSGKVGIIAAATHEIEEDKALSTQLGERFLYYEIQERDIKLILDRCSSLSPKESERHRIESQKQLKKFIKEILREKNRPINIGQDVEDKLQQLVQLARMLKTPVKRDYSTRQVIDIYPAEWPARLRNLLVQLGKGIALVQRKEEVDLEIYSILCRVCINSCPRMRIKALEALLKGPRTLEDMQNSLGKISEAAVRRILEDLELSCLVTKEIVRKKYGRPVYIYRLSSQCRELLKEANPYASITAFYTSQ